MLLNVIAVAVIAVAVLSCGAAAAADIAIAVSTDAVAATTPRNFLAHGWESFQASSANLTALHGKKRLVK